MGTKQRFGRFEIHAPLGRGGMGDVFTAVDTESGEPCALKLLRPELVTTARWRSRFLREGQAARRAEHPNVVRVLEVGTDGGDAYIALELLRGASLDTLLRAPTPLALRTLVAFGYQIADGLSAIHEVGVVHRDLKPSNVFVHRPSESCLLLVKLLDFGISKLSGEDATGSHSFLGSPKYMSPEQIVSAKAVDHRTDLWSLGVLLFDALVGKPPHEGRDVAELLLAIANQPAASIDEARPDLPAELRRVVRELLRPVRRRTPDAKQVRDALGRLLATSLPDLTLSPRAQGGEPTLKLLPESPEEITLVEREFGRTFTLGGVARGEGAATVARAEGVTESTTRDPPRRSS